jgi:8-oxo-(d)GTP phosphatase
LTTRVYVVRHAKAGDRDRWTKPDDVRPLTKAGRRQAERLVEQFAGKRLGRLLSSPSLRCVQTFEPLAASLGLPIETKAELADGMPYTYLEKLALEVAPDGPGAVCVHGDALRFMVEDLLDRGVRLRGTGAVGYRKGSTWVLGVRDGTVVTAKYVPPPSDKSAPRKKPP